MLQKKQLTPTVIVGMVYIAMALLLLNACDVDNKQAISVVTFQEEVVSSVQACSNSSTELPILKLIPSDGATVVRPNTPIKFYFDSNDRTYYKYYKKLKHGQFSVWINCEVQPATFDTENNVITVDNNVLERYTEYDVALNIGGKPGRGKCPPQKKHVTKFSFQTGSAIGEATNLDASVEQSPVGVTEKGRISIEVTDDYGLPATHATVDVTSNSETLTADELSLEDNDDGKGIIELNDNVAESVDLTVTSQDTLYNDPVDTQTWNGTIVFIEESGGDTDIPETCPGDLPTDYQGDAIVVSDTLNVRYGPSMDSPVAYILDKNETVTVSSVVDGEWAFIGYDNGRPVYTSICYLIADAPEPDPDTCPGNLSADYTGEAIVVAETLNVRYGPDASAPVAYTLNKNESVTVESVVDDEWAFIGYSDGRPVYASICYLEEDELPDEDEPADGEEPGNYDGLSDDTVINVIKKFSRAEECGAGSYVNKVIFPFEEDGYTVLVYAAFDKFILDDYGLEQYYRPWGLGVGLESAKSSITVTSIKAAISSNGYCYTLPSFCPNYSDENGLIYESKRARGDMIIQEKIIEVKKNMPAENEWAFSSNYSNEVDYYTPLSNYGMWVTFEMEYITNDDQKTHHVELGEHNVMIQPQIDSSFATYIFTLIQPEWDNPGETHTDPNNP